MAPESSMQVTAYLSRNLGIFVGEDRTITYLRFLSGRAATHSFSHTLPSRSGNHSATQSTFASPCTKSGIDSGFVPIPANSTLFGQWTFTVDNSSTPLWFFCAQAGHCEKGMVFAVNPTQDKSFQAFLANAQGNETGASSAGGSSTIGASASGVVSTTAGAAASASSSTNGAAASSTANANTTSNGAVPSLRIHRVVLTIVALAFGTLL
ncbi:uncharacterized protein EV420DRAFT_1655282 [Desarmillaria tabescens]|uniref:Phytocyanin domain-containing protein n=1 Tax=Armillaria tabescens TaxID=1929756 RepID=A0AA39IYB8_ARMTA|nr:uncharacterized protein EV420DRAFT_1655282 [Desarmillaria tabescens]KAK0432742.1 hypothetical protein EV420DRAFT_1655282 [Desarmillaria tabescens]